MSELNRKEFKLRQDMAAWNTQRREAETRDTERTQKDAERAAQEELWKQDPLAVLTHFGHKLDSVVDLVAAGGMGAPEVQIKLLQGKLSKVEQDAATKKKAEDDAAAGRRAQDEVRAFMRGELAKAVRDPRFQPYANAPNLADAVEQEFVNAFTSEKVELTPHQALELAVLEPEVERLGKESRFELCGRTDGIAREVHKVMLGKIKEGSPITTEQALELCEVVLDARIESYAQSEKLKARFASKPPEKADDTQAKPDATRQTEGPTAKQTRAITIKNRNQAAAPARTTVQAPQRISSADAKAQAAANLARLFKAKA